MTFNVSCHDGYFQRCRLAAVSKMSSPRFFVPPGKRIAEHGQRKIGALLKGGDSLHRRQTSTARLVSDGNKWPTIAFGTAKVVPKPWMKQVALHET
jgi:hypothetical protein